MFRIFSPSLFIPPSMIYFDCGHHEIMVAIRGHNLTKEVVSDVFLNKQLGHSCSKTVMLTMVSLSQRWGCEPGFGDIEAALGGDEACLQGGVHDALEARQTSYKLGNTLVLLNISSF